MKLESSMTSVLLQQTHKQRSFFNTYLALHSGLGGQHSMVTVQLVMKDLRLVYDL